MSRFRIDTRGTGSTWGVLTSRFAWPLAAATLLAGCLSTHPRYTRLRVTNPRGELIADWVAVGPITRVENGYRTTAVERTSGPPYSTLTRYPDGWPTTAVGPNISHWHCPAPDWLQEFESYGFAK